MSKLLERIWVAWGQDWVTGVACTKKHAEYFTVHHQEYIRADVAEAMVAAAFEQAQHTAQIAWDWPESEASSAPVCEAIAKLTPVDARAALDRIVRDNAADVWSAVAHLAKSGTPIDAIEAIACGNAAALRKKMEE